MRQVGAMLHQQFDSNGYGVLMTLRKPQPPFPKLNGVFDLPRHCPIIFLIRNLPQETTGNFGMETPTRATLLLAGECWDF